MIQKQDIVRAGRATVPDWDDWEWDAIQPA